VERNGLGKCVYGINITWTSLLNDGENPYIGRREKSCMFLALDLGEDSSASSACPITHIHISRILGGFPALPPFSEDLFPDRLGNIS
jgi:hypothetical protein